MHRVTLLLPSALLLLLHRWAGALRRPRSHPSLHLLYLRRAGEPCGPQLHSACLLLGDLQQHGLRSSRPFPRDQAVGGPTTGKTRPHPSCLPTQPTAPPADNLPRCRRAWSSRLLPLLQALVSTPWSCSLLRLLRGCWSKSVTRFASSG